MEPLSGRAPREQNRVPVLFAESSAQDGTIVPLEADPATGRLLVNTTGGGGGGGTVQLSDGVTTSRLASVLGLTDSNPLTVAIVNGTGDQITSFGGGTQYQELATTTPATGTLALGRYQTSLPTLTNGQMNEPMLDSTSTLLVNSSTLATAANQTNGSQLTSVVSKADNVTTGNIVANGGTVTAAVVAGVAGWTMAYQGTYATGASLTMEASFDGGTVYDTCRMLQGSSGTLGYVTTIAAVVNSSSYFVADIPSGATNVRVRCTAWAAPTGTINVTIAQSVERFASPAVGGQAVSVTGTISGLKTSNAAIPAATNLGVLPSVANAAKPSFSETFGTALSTDLNGNLRTRIDDGAGNDRAANVDANSNLNTHDVASSVTGSAVPTSAIYVGINGPNITGINAIANVSDGVNGTGTVSTSNMIYNGTNQDRMRSANGAAATTGTGLLGSGNLIFDGTNWQKQTTATAIGTVGTTSAVVNVGQKTVATTATQVSASSTVPTNGIIIQALSTNAASIFVGGSGVTTSTGFELVAGQAISFTCNLNTLYIISVASTTDKICYNVE